MAKGRLRCHLFKKHHRRDASCGFSRDDTDIDVTFFHGLKGNYGDKRLHRSPFRSHPRLGDQTDCAIEAKSTFQNPQPCIRVNI